MVNNNDAPSENEDKAKTEAAPDQDDQSQTSPSQSSQEGQDDKQTEALSQVPDKLRGKSESDLIKMYGELERKLGEQSTTVAEAKKLRENQQILEKAIFSDPELVKKVEDAVKKVTNPQVDSQVESGQDGDGEVKKIIKDPEITELRRAAENRIITDFYNQYGLNKLPQEEKQDQFKKIGKEILDMLDPGGEKSLEQVISSINLEKLPKMLEKAYLLSNLDNAVSTGKKSLDFASIGAMPSSSSQAEERVSLTEDERKVARALGVTEDNYLKRKKEMQS